MNQVLARYHVCMRQSAFLLFAAVLICCLSASQAAALPLISGTVDATDQPVAGASIQLWTVGTSGYGSQGTRLATTTSDARGHWTISTFTCSPANALVYVYALGGNAGFGANSAIQLEAWLGPCNALPPQVNINEVTTVASLWAELRFVVNFSGAPASNAQGIFNVGLNAANLADVILGSAPGLTLPPGATAPVATINTLGNIIYGCVHSSGPSSTACVNLFSAATPSGGSAPIGTGSALRDIALHPTNNVNLLFALAAGGPFTPALSAAPTDWTLVVNYSSPALDGPGQLAIDAGGNVWVTNSLNNSISEFNPAGSPLGAFTGGGLNIPFGVAIDLPGNIWVTNQGNNSISKFDPLGNPLSPGGGFTGGGLEDPQYIAVGRFGGDIWIANCGDFCDHSGTPSSLSQFDPSTGNPISPNTGFRNSSLVGSVGIAVDTFGQIWVTNEGTNSVTGFNGSGVVIRTVKGGGGLSDPVGITIDRSNALWVTDQMANAVTAYVENTASFPFPSPGITGGGISGPLGIAVDSSFNKFLANSTALVEIDPSGNIVSPSTGFVDPNNNEPDGVAIDASGSVWVTNTGNNTLSQWVGLAVPVKTPAVLPARLP
jgi:streptogramin lyase